MKELSKDIIKEIKTRVGVLAINPPKEDVFRYTDKFFIKGKLTSNDYKELAAHLIVYRSMMIQYRIS